MERRGNGPGSDRRGKRPYYDKTTDKGRVDFVGGGEDTDDGGTIEDSGPYSGGGTPPDSKTKGESDPQL